MKATFSRAGLDTDADFCSGSLELGAEFRSGPQGKKGDTGDTGPQGPQGVGISGAEIDANGHLLLTLLNPKTAAASVIDSGRTRGDTGPMGATGRGLEYLWDGTKLGVRVAGDTAYTYADLKGATGNTGKSIQYNWDGTKLGIRLEGQTNYTYVDLRGEKGNTGDTGRGLEFDWRGTQLGVRLAGAGEFTYVELKGATGATGSSGVYYGTAEPTDPNVTVWVDPEGSQLADLDGVSF